MLKWGMMNPNPASIETQPEERMPYEDNPEIVKKELQASLARNKLLEKENQELKREVTHLKAQIASLKAHDIERRSTLWKKLQNSDDPKLMEKVSQKPDLPRVPPPKAPPLIKLSSENKIQQAPAPPPPPPPPKMLVRTKAVRRIPEVMELYRSLTRRDARSENKTNGQGIPSVKFSKNMIGEIENRSTYLLAIKSDVEAQGEFINYLAKQVETASFTTISDVEEFVKWLDKELSYLVDERAVLKHFPQWPERKADALREAAFSYRDLKNLESEVSAFKDNPKQSLAQSLKRIQALQDRLEQCVDNTERMRESTTRRYKELQIPWDWMMDKGVIGQLKLSSMRLARQYMKRIVKELQSNDYSREEELLLQGARFAYRVHQFAGGFDEDTTQAFEELRRVRTSLEKQQIVVNSHNSVS